MLVRRPQRDQAERVGLRRLADEPRVRERDDEPDGDDRADDERDARSRRADRDPAEHGDEYERREEEEVAVLHAVGREPTGEGADDEGGRGDERQRGGHVLAQPRRELRADRDEDDQHDHRDDGDVQRQLLDVPEPEAQDVADVVASLADDAVGAEEVGERPAPRELGADHERGERDDGAEQGRERAKDPPVARDERQHEGREHDRREEPERLRARRDRGGEREREERDAPPRRQLEHAHERPRDDERDRVEEVLGHDRRRVGERRERYREHGGEEREPPPAHAAGEEPGRHRRERHDERVQRLRQAVRGRQRVGEPR